MQAVDTDRVKLDDRCWSVKCAECGTWFEATRSDASFCTPAHRKRWHERPIRFQNAMLELRMMARRVNEIAEKYATSQTAFDEMQSLGKAVKNATATFEVPWTQKTLEDATPAPSTGSAGRKAKAAAGRQPK